MVFHIENPYISNITNVFSLLRIYSRFSEIYTLYSFTTERRTKQKALKRFSTTLHFCCFLLEIAAFCVELGANDFFFLDFFIDYFCALESGYDTNRCRNVKE